MGRQFTRNRLGYWEGFIDLGVPSTRILVLADDGDDSTFSKAHKRALQQLAEGWPTIAATIEPLIARDAGLLAGEAFEGLIECVHLLDVDDGEQSCIGLEVRAANGNCQCGVLLHAGSVIAVGGVDVALSRWRCRRALQQATGDLRSSASTT
jgi:hypothetical protein